MDSNKYLMINWKNFLIGFLGGTCGIFFITTIDQHGKYEREKRIVETYKRSLKADWAIWNCECRDSTYRPLPGFGPDPFVIDSLKRYKRVE